MHRLSALLLSLCVAVATLSGCGSSSGSGSSTFNPPPVQAASYSNASVSGTYAVNLTDGDANGIYTSMGTFSADGNGNLSSGALTEYTIGGSCTVTFTGTYAIQGDGSGTGTFLTSPGGATPCSHTGTLQLAVQAVQQGALLYIAESDGIAMATGSAGRK